MPHESVDILARGGTTESNTVAEVSGSVVPAIAAPIAGAEATDKRKTDPALFEACRVTEALLFASASPVRANEIARVLPADTAVSEVLTVLREHYQGRGVELAKVGNAWAFRTASDVADRLTVEKVRRRKLSRAEIEEIRGVTVSPGTLDILFEEGWIEPRGRKQVPGRPTTWQTTAAFLDHFGLESRNDLPGLRDLRKAGLLSPTPDSPVPLPGDPDEAAVEAWKNTA